MRGHGSRGDDPLVYNALDTIEFKTDLDEVLSHVEKHIAQADISRLGVTGFSLGAVNTWYYGTHGTYRPLAIAPVAGPIDLERHLAPETGTPVRCWKSDDTCMSYTASTGEQRISVTKEYCLEKNREGNALRQIKNLKNVAVLFQRGLIDPATDYDADMKELSGFFDHNKHKCFRTILYPGLGHAYTCEEHARIREFFKEWL